MQVTLSLLPNFVFDLRPGDRIFLKGNLGAGKTTFATLLVKNFLKKDITVTSPTYTYYQEYPDNLYHFDLYRVSERADLLRIGADEIFDDPKSICLIEWPEILGDHIQPTKIVTFEEIPGGREMSITDCQASSIDKA